MAAMSTTPLDSFLATLETSRLLSPAQTAVIREQLATRGDIKPTSLAKWLVDRKLVTLWQAEELLAGRKSFHLHKYKLLQRVGKGASGTVYKAEHTGMDRVVAVKVMDDNLVEKPEQLARFKQETRLAAQLQHPNIIAAFDAECDGSTHFLVMEYMEGRDLNQWLHDHNPLPIAWACECIRQAAAGLQHAHEKGLIHRDIKPGNLLVSGTDVNSRPLLKILDMGFARKMDDDTGVRITKAWQIFGTPDYMSPEQAESTLNADIRSDIFSLGCTLFKLITNQLPFPGETPVQKLLARANRDAPPITSLRPDAPAALEKIVAKMLARKPEKRYQTPGEVAAALSFFCGEFVEGSNAAPLLNAALGGLDAGRVRTTGLTDLDEERVQEVSTVGNVRANLGAVDRHSEATFETGAGATLRAESSSPGASSGSFGGSKRQLAEKKEPDAPPEEITTMLSAEVMRQ
ncbi:MAG TPA: serine/threonine-protein kinase, partial [Pirellulales bacterium]